MGFELNDVFMVIFMFIRMYKEGEVRIINEYEWVVKYEGNVVV